MVTFISSPDEIIISGHRRGDPSSDVVICKCRSDDEEAWSLGGSSCDPASVSYSANIIKLLQSL